MKKKFAGFMVLSAFVLGGLLPVVASAQTPVQQTCGAVGGSTVAASSTSTIETIICRIGSILNTIIPFLIVLGVLYFAFGVVSYVIGGDEEAKTKGRDRMIYGVIGLAVIVGVWGLVGILNRTFNPTTGGTVTVPCIVGTPGC